MSIRKITLFDLDATLTDQEGAFRLWAAEFSAATTISVPWLLKAEKRHAFFTDIKVTYGVSASIARMHADYRRRSAELVPHRPEVCAAIQALAEDDWALGVVTNGAPEPQRIKLDVSGLADFFPSLIISGEYGIRKPDRATASSRTSLAATRRGCRPSGCPPAAPAVQGTRFPRTPLPPWSMPLIGCSPLLAPTGASPCSPADGSWPCRARPCGVCSPLRPPWPW
ncbi:HAD hydrolase-like protein [Streptomyces mirabilis]|uniref:HAD family hydrolase n=1 Tax=Streptomyces mirabilis TaxID=68239 RepID=UPI003FA1E72A